MKWREQKTSKIGPAAPGQAGEAGTCRHHPARSYDRAEAAFWRSAVWLAAGIGPTDAGLPIGMETALSVARLGAEVNACGGKATKRASALEDVDTSPNHPMAPDIR